MSRSRTFYVRALLLWIVGAIVIGAGVYALTSRLPASGASGAHAGSSTGPVAAYYGQPQMVAPAQRKAAPDVSGKLLDGGTLSLKSLRGKVVVLNSWASWCSPCRQELPALERFARTAGAGVTVLGIDVEDTSSGAKSMSRTYGLSYPSLLDPSGSTLVSLGAFVPPADVPSTIVVDADGRVAATIIGPIDEPALAKAVKQIAEGT
jgi:thiol-disulfide isomerase/thioredoxin